MKGSTDYALCVYDVGDSRRAEAESASHIVKTAHFSRGVAPKLKRNTNGITEALHSVYAVSAYSNDNRITCQ